jgi:hypothetical protein
MDVGGTGAERESSVDEPARAARADRAQRNRELLRADRDAPAADEGVKAAEVRRGCGGGARVARRFELESYFLRRTRRDHRHGMSSHASVYIFLDVLMGACVQVLTWLSLPALKTGMVQEAQDALTVRPSSPVPLQNPLPEP